MKSLFIFIVLFFVATTTNAQTKMYISKTSGGTDSIALSEIKGISFNNYQHPFFDSLVAWYPLNGNADDTTLNKNNGTISGLTFLVDNQSTVAQFTSQSYIEINDKSYLDFSGVSGVSFSFWLKQSLSESGFILIKLGLGGGDDDEYYISINADGTLSGGFNASASNYKSISSIKKLTSNTWHHVVLSWEKSSGNIAFYLNGVLDNKISTTINLIQNTTTPIRIGKALQTGMNSFTGSMDDLRIYNKKLSDIEIQTLIGDGH